MIKLSEIKIFAVPIGVANMDDEEKFKEQAKKIGYVWSPDEFKKDLENKNFLLYGLIMKTLPVKIEGV